MSGSYVESSVHKKVTGKDNLIKVGLIAGTVFIALIGILSVNYLLLLVAVVAGGASAYIIPRLKIMYEYIFCDGQLDFDKIMGGEKRKNMMKIDFEDVVVMAPAKSHALDGYRHNGVKVYDFSSMKEEQKRYAVVTKKNDQAVMIYFEPDEKMVSVIKQKAGRKFSEY